MTDGVEDKVADGGMQPWAQKTWRGLAAFMTFAALLWNVDFFEWFGLALVQEQYQAFILALSLAVVFLSVRINRAENRRVPWYDMALAAISLAQNKAHLAKSMGAFNRLKPATFGEPDSLPYHPGAVRALRKLGIKVSN